MPIPKRVKVGPFVYDVSLKSAEEFKALEGSDPPLMGHCDHMTLTISIREDMAEGAIAEVLLHEILHACCNGVGQPISAANTTGMDSSDIEELMVTTISPVLLQALRVNPAVLRYLGVTRNGEA